MLRKISLSLLAIASMATATEVTFSGAMSADVESNFSPSWKQVNSANQDLTLTTRAQFEEKTAVELRISNYSTVKNPLDTNQRIASVVRGVEPGRQAAISDSASRWGAMHFDGIQFQWEFSRMAKLIVGDLVYSAGQTSYYGYSWAREYGAIMKENRLRGLGFKLADQGEIYLGAPDANDRAIWGYATYGGSLIKRTDEKLFLRGLGDLVFKNGGRERRWTLGGEGEYSKAMTNYNYGGKLDFGLRPYAGTYTYTWLVEPSFSYKKFSLGATYYQALLAKQDSSVKLQTDIPEEQFVYVEPIISVNQKFSVGLSGEWHNPSTSVKDDDYVLASPTFYLYPAEKMTLTFWQRNEWETKNAHYSLGLGLSGQVNF